MVIRIDALPQTALQSLQHELPAMKDGLTVKLTVSQIVGLTPAPAEPGSVIHGATAKATLADNDELGVADSATSYVLKRTKLTELISSIFKTTRKIANAYFLSSFRLWDATDNTKGLGWVLSGITTATTRLITMADRDVNLTSVPTPWVSYAPTFNGIGTAASIKCRSRRVGANLEVEVQFTTGTVTATNFDMTLGFNGVNGSIVCDTFWNGNRPVVGVGVLNVAGATALYVLGLGGSNLINISFASSGRDGLSPVPGTALGSASVVSLRLTVPIDGWNV